MGILDKLKKQEASDDPQVLWEQFFKAAVKSDWKKSMVLIIQLQELDPGNPQVFMKHGDILQRTGDSDSAIEAYHKAALGHMEIGETQKALAIYKIIMRLN